MQRGNSNGVQVYGQNKNFLNYTSQAEQKIKAKELELAKKLELAKLENKTKLEIEKIKAQHQLEIQKLKSQSKVTIANTDATTKVKTSKIDAQVLREKTFMTMYISIAFAVVLIVGLVLLYFNAKKNRELKQQQHENEMMMKQKELEEQRLHKMLDLIADGKISKDVENEILLTMSRSNMKLLTINNDD
jgi:hypothetical protein